MLLRKGVARPSSSRERTDAEVLTRVGAWLDARLPRPELRACVRDWRRRRPFWAGLLLIAGGTELVLVPLAPLNVLVNLGLGGLAAIGIGIALAVAGVFLWAAPHARHYVSINALILSVLSFAATNLGGFLVGMILGIAGSALGFGWTPEPDPDTDTLPDTAADGARSPEPGADPGGVGNGGLRRGGTRCATGRPSRTAPGRLDGHGYGRMLAGPLPLSLPLCLLALLLVPGAARADTARTAPASPTPPSAAATPPTITASRFAPEGFSVAGVREVPTRNGPVRAMVVQMKAASLTDYRLRTRGETDAGNHGELSLGADSLRLDGAVTLYLTELKGCIQGVLCLTFTPDRLPVPPLVPPFVFISDVEAEQALVTSDLIRAADLRLRTGPARA